MSLSLSPSLPLSPSLSPSHDLYYAFLLASPISASVCLSYLLSSFHFLILKHVLPLSLPFLLSLSTLSRSYMYNFCLFASISLSVFLPLPLFHLLSPFVVWGHYLSSRPWAIWPWFIPPSKARGRGEGRPKGAVTSNSGFQSVSHLPVQTDRISISWEPGPHPGPSESETLGVRPHNLGFNKSSGDSDAS